jgi:hypothetical protein
MTYATGQTAIYNRIIAHASFDANNTSESDWGILNTGNAAYYAILKPSPDPAPIEWITFTIYMIHWTTIVEVWQRYVDETTTQAALYGHTGQIIAQMQPYNRLTGNTIAHAEAVSVGTPTEEWKSGAKGPAWLKQEINIQWHEQSTPQTYV